MTVIAWDGKTLASDKRMITGGGICRTVTKIERFGDSLIGITGGLDVAIEMREWFKAGAHPESFPESARKDTSTLIVITADGVSAYASGPFPVPMECTQAAFGSGRDFAEAAMYLGHSARVGVEIACALQSDCGNGIDELTMRTTKAAD